ncbi:MAG TPA: mannose-1-phosphate guanylyltransferase, partial [Ornithinibacter sp.]|nr:mannose-1-phosphate guanylyltransferase [Ornithinibacter sp.]
MSTIPGFWAVVPAGGAGTRLWPLSRAAHPKFLLDLTGSGRTLLQATVDRLEPLTGDRVVVVTGAAHADAVRAQLPGLAGDQVLAEPSPRDSMAAIGLAAAVVERQDPQAVIGSFAADHVIPDTAAFESVIREAAEVAREGHLVTIGIEPTSPATGFGYIRAGEALPGFATALRAVEFVEKPDAVRAAQYVASGEFRWNAGMFVVRAATLLDLLAQWHHELAAGVRAIAASPERLDELWPGLTRIAIDHAVAEPAADAGHVVVVPAPFTWDDVGDFASLAELLPPVEGEPGLRVLGSVDDVTTIDASGIVAAAGGRRVAVVGIEDVVVIDTPDAVLVTTRSRAQDVKAVVDA